jgi:hypothetical protein
MGSMRETGSGKSLPHTGEDFIVRRLLEMLAMALAVGTWEKNEAPAAFPREG